MVCLLIQQHWLGLDKHARVNRTTHARYPSPSSIHPTINNNIKKLGIVPVFTEPLEQLGNLPFGDIIPWVQMAEFAVLPRFALAHPNFGEAEAAFYKSLDAMTGPNNRYEQKHRLIMKLRPYLVWSPTNFIKPFELYMTAFWRGISRGRLADGQDVINDFCEKYKELVYT